MKRSFLLIITFSLLAFFAGFAFAQDLIIFPAKGQSEEQMEKDKFDCYQWAKKQTGFDPMQPQETAQAPPPQSQGPQGERIKGAARGAVVGAVVGEIANDDAGKGAAAGAAGGAIAGGMRSRQKRRQQSQAQQQQAQQQAAAAVEKRNTYNRAYTACMEAKGYTVK